MTPENNQSNLNINIGQTHYQPPNGYNNNPPLNGPAFVWPSPDGTNNASNTGSDYYLPPINPMPIDSMPYLTPPFIEGQTELYRQAARRADAKLRFSKHLRNYVLVNLFLWGIAIITTIGSLGHHFSFWGSFWPLWVTVFWGIGLLSEYVNVFIMNDHRRQAMIEEEMQRLRR